MDINYLTIFATIINFALLAAIIIVLYKVIKGIKCFIGRNKEMDRKLDTILNKLDDKDES